MPHDHSCGPSCGCSGPSTGPRPDVAQIPPPWRPAQNVRPLVIGVFRHADRILAAPVHDDDGQIRGWRPLGGQIAFRETAADALIREIREETGQEICDLTHVGALENLYEHHGCQGHEIVLVYAARFVRSEIYDADQLSYSETDGIEQHAKWISIAKARAGRVPLFPAGLVDLL